MVTRQVLIRIVCAWCRRVMVDGPATGPISHGCCDTCFERLISEC